MLYNAKHKIVIMPINVSRHIIEVNIFVVFSSL